jgi:hypothetical protein
MWETPAAAAASIAARLRVSSGEGVREAFRLIEIAHPDFDRRA